MIVIMQSHVGTATALPGAHLPDHCQPGSLGKPVHPRCLRGPLTHGGDPEEPSICTPGFPGGLAGPGVGGVSGED